MAHPPMLHSSAPIWRACIVGASPVTAPAWSPALNLVAVGLQGSNGSVEVALLDAIQPQEHIRLQVPTESPDDHLVSVGWSPLGCRHLLLTVTQQGSVVVWGQTPTEPPQDEGPQPESAATPSQQQPQPSTHSTAHPTVHSLNDWYPQRLAFSPPSDADQYAPPPSQPAAGLWGAAGVPGGTSGVVAGRQSLNPATSVDDFLADPHAVPDEPPPSAPSAPAGTAAQQAPATAGGAGAASTIPPPPCPVPGGPGGWHAVSAHWLGPLPMRRWSTRLLAAESMGSPSRTMEELFQLAPPAATPAGPHWCRPGQLAFAVVYANGGMRVWWAALSGAPTGLTWRCTGVLPLLPAPTPQTSGQHHQLTPGPDVISASVTPSPNGNLTAALVTHSRPGSVTLVSVSGDPRHQHVAGLPPALHWTVSQTVILDVTQAIHLSCPQLGADHQLHNWSLSVLLPEAGVGHLLHVLAQQGPVPAAADGRGFQPGMEHSLPSTASCSHLLMYRQAGQPAAAGHTKQQAWDWQLSWQSQATGKGGLLGRGSDPEVQIGGPGLIARQAGVLAATSDGSKVLWGTGAEVRVLDTEGQETLTSLPLHASPSHTQGTSAIDSSSGLAEIQLPAHMGSGVKGSSNRHSDAMVPQSACFSASGACCAVVSASGNHPSFEVAAYVVPELPPLPSHHQQAGQTGGSIPGGNETPEEAQRVEVEAKLDAFRLAWCIGDGSLPDDVIARAVRAAHTALQHSSPQQPQQQQQQNGGDAMAASVPAAVVLASVPPKARAAAWQRMMRTCQLLDMLLHDEEVHPRGSYASAADRLKLALLPHIPGRLALVIHADIMARHMLHQAFQAVTISSVTATDESGARTTRFAPADIPDLQTWIDWVTDYIMLLLSSLSAWAAARSGAQNKDGSSHKSEEDGSAQQAQGSEQQHQATLALAATAASQGTEGLWVQQAVDPYDPAPEEVPYALPCIRLLLDKKAMAHLLQVFTYWKILRQKAGAPATAEAAAALHQRLETLKQATSALSAFMQLHSKPSQQSSSAGVAGGQQGQEAYHSAKELADTLQATFPGPLQLHYSRTVPVSNLALLPQLLSSPSVIAAPRLGPAGCLAKARSLGLLPPALPLVGRGILPGTAPSAAFPPLPSSSSTTSGCTSYRLPLPPPPAHLAQLFAPATLHVMAVPAAADGVSTPALPSAGPSAAGGGTGTVSRTTSVAGAAGAAWRQVSSASTATLVTSGPLASPVSGGGGELTSNNPSNPVRSGEIMSAGRRHAAAIQRWRIAHAASCGAAGLMPFAALQDNQQLPASTLEGSDLSDSLVYSSWVMREKDLSYLSNGSTSVAALSAAQGNAPGVLDVMAGTVIEPGSGAWEYEGASVMAVSGNTQGAAALQGLPSAPALVTVQLREAFGTEAATPGTLLHARRAWLTACPLSGRPWKRVRSA